MTKLLKKAFAEAAKLSNQEQDAFAALLLEELAIERSWARSLESSQEKLASLADEALSEFKRGDTKPLRDL
jgi:hypothetical protein